ncbi:BTB/POZ domain-containing protein at3g49900, partial [Phtheirospermum japonicum]
YLISQEALIARSAHLRRKLTEFPEITLSPPLNITAQTFSSVTEFCYGAHVEITPSNVAALRTAAELLDMTESYGPEDQNLQQITEEYFRDFQLILESTSQRLTDCHDLLYRIIDIFLKENIETLSDDHKIQMCNYIDCGILSPKLLMHAVQNPRMPLRFVVQAMFLQQLNTRHNIISAANDHLNNKKHGEDQKDSITLGAILQRDAALRQVSHLKAVMSATNSRIQTLERELSGMRKLMNESESIKNRIDSGRSASFRFSSDSSNKIERGQRGSVSALSLRNVKTEVMSSSEESSSDGCPKVEKSFGRRLVSGLKSAFGLQKKKRESKANGLKNRENFEGEDGNEDKIVIIKKDQAFHRRSSSQS